MDLTRFVSAQADGVFDRALDELRSGAKVSHWMWFVFPQISGLGRSETARHYALAGRAEAALYHGHPVLGPRLANATDVMLGWAGRRGAATILGTVDAMKLRSSMTLFAVAAPDDPRFAETLAAFFDGPDKATLDRL